MESAFVYHSGFALIDQASTAAITATFSIDGVPSFLSVTLGIGGRWK